MQFGSLVHAILQECLPAIEAAGGIGRVAATDIAAVVADACRAVAASWETEQPVPPALLWKLRLREAEEMASAALSWPLPPYVVPYNPTLVTSCTESTNPIKS